MEEICKILYIYSCVQDQSLIHITRIQTKRLNELINYRVVKMCYICFSFTLVKIDSNTTFNLADFQPF